MKNKLTIRAKENDSDTLQLLDETNEEWVSLWRSAITQIGETEEKQSPIQLSQFQPIYAIS